MKTISILFFLISFNCFSQSKLSGIYDSIKLGFDSQNNTITGYFKEWEVDKKTITNKCEFFVKGTIENNKKEASVAIYSNDYQLLTHGNINFSYEGILGFRLEKNIQQCKTMMPEITSKEGISLAKKWETNWKAIGLIKSQKAYFYANQNDKLPTKIYVIKGDFVGIIERKYDWTKVEYITTKNKVLSGWIKKNDLIAE